jgi:hypothetical protein
LSLCKEIYWYWIIIVWLILMVYFYHMDKFWYADREGPLWSWSYGSWIYNLLCNQCLSPLSFVSSNPAHGEVYWMYHYVIKFVSDLRQVGGFLLVSSTNKTDRHDITEILLKVALSTISNHHLLKVYFYHMDKF